MSHYTTLQGELVYPAEDDLQRVLGRLDGEWAEDNRWVDERGDPRGRGPAVNWASVELTIPYGSYRNIGRVLPEVRAPATEGWIVATTTDGEYRGTVYRPSGAEPDADLVEWGAEVFSGDVPVEDDSAFLDWIDAVERAFHRSYSE